MVIAEQQSLIALQNYNANYSIRTLHSYSLEICVSNNHQSIQPKLQCYIIDAYLLATLLHYNLIS